jgi:16S rRNA G966 N2-methylase RsmD
LLGLAASAAVAAVLIAAIALAVSYPNLPEIDSLTDYRPKLPMRVFSADGVLLGEFGGKVDLIYIDPPFDTGADFSFKVLVGPDDEPLPQPAGNHCRG